MTTPAGFALRSCTYNQLFEKIKLIVLLDLSYSYFFLRLAIWVVLNTRPANFFCLIAVVCTSFSGINCPTSKRTPTTPWGDCSKQYVRVSHLREMISFVCLRPIKFNLICSIQGRQFIGESFLLTLRPDCSSGRNVYDWTASLFKAAMVSTLRMAFIRYENVAGWVVGQTLRSSFSAAWLMGLVYIWHLIPAWQKIEIVIFPCFTF